MIIKKYKNRKLYNTATSSYITLSDVLGFVVADMDFSVICNDTGKDLSNQILVDLASHYSVKLRSETLELLIQDIKLGVTV